MSAGAAEQALRPRLLILSFSEIGSDARVRRQAELFSREYRVTTCGYGGPFSDEVEHIELSRHESRLDRAIESLSLRLRLYGLGYRCSAGVRKARRALRGRRFEAAILNDLPAAGVLRGIVPDACVLLDLHEYWPGLHDDVAAWRRLRLPYLQWMLRTQASRAAACTTVNSVIAELYRQEYDLAPAVVANAGPYRRYTPSETRRPIRMVHSGGVNPGRRIDVMMRAVAASRADVTLDLYLMGEGSAPRRELEALAEALGERIRVLPPVPSAELVGVLNDYDVGIHVLAPSCTNNEVALPNKFFDFVQARLAIVTGPTEAMAELLERHELGLVTADFSEEAVTAAVDGLTPERVRMWKQHAERAAVTLAGEHQMETWREIVDHLSRRGTGEVR